MSTIKITGLTSSGAIVGNVILPMVGNVAGTLTTLRGTVDQLKTFITAGAEANILAANAATIFANTIQSAQIIAANLGMKGYVDSVSDQSIYTNSNVLAYLTGGFNGNIIPSGNLTYSLGSHTNRWKDLYLGSSTIYIGNTAISSTASGTISVTPKIVLVDTSITSNDLAFPWALTSNPEVLANTSSSVSATLVFANTISAGTTSQALTYGTDYELVPTGDGYANIRLIGLNISSPPVGWPGYGQLTIIETPPAGGTTDISGNLTVSGNIANIRLGVSGRITFADGTVQSTANAGVTTANLGMIGYVDNKVSTANLGMIGYVDNKVSTANVGIIGYIGLGNTIVTAGITAANVGMLGQVNAVVTEVTIANTIVTAGIVSANLGLKGYVDLANTIQSQLLANLGALDLTTLNSAIGVHTAQIATLDANAAVQAGNIAELFANAAAQAVLISSLGNTQQIEANITTLQSNAATQSDLIIGINANVSAANIGIKGYVDSRITLANTGITTANTGILGYIDSRITVANAGVTAANVGVIGYINLANTIQSEQITAANLGIIGYINFSNTIQSAQIDTLTANSAVQGANINALLSSTGALTGQISEANLGLKGYVDQANTIQSAQINAANLAITAANLGMKGYVDSVASQSIYGNANVTAYTVSMGFTNFSNVNVAALITTNGLTNYSNVNTKAYAESMGYQNYGNVNVAAYVTTANSAVIGYVDNKVSTANIGMNGFVNAVIDAVNVANIVITQSIVSANVGVIGYINLANTIQSSQITAANLGIYTMGNVTHWTSNVSTVSAALDQLASRIYNIVNP